MTRPWTPPYHGGLRRRGRQLRRLAEALGQPSARSGGVIVPTFWWDGHPNFGDDLTPWLLPRYGIVPLYREPRTARLVGVGSLLEFLPGGYSGAIWGSGLMGDVRHPLPHATVLAVRGPLTAERIGLSSAPAYGDPGLLVGRLLPRPPGDGRIAVVPHGHHRAHPGLAALVAAAGDGARVVNVHQRAAPAVREIAASRGVVTTSLHGLVTADAYGIPAVWTTLDPPLGGGDFKFRDYEAALTPGRTRYRPLGGSLEDTLDGAEPVDPAAVAALSDGLEAAITRVRGLPLGQRPFPAGIPAALRSR
ncbi:MULTISPECIES: polysaccharide pyruvyl transferase family protein [Microbacterium]|uniref:polysaccharide pyruvyl transferase family protein n=1 Tax=Microbacterium TaxID=33882 RepID=UPI00217E7F79|nr:MULTISPECIES: polysaccharide pyruvyl transferase family protein [Microbacterium]UWF77886.1 polysaccharide pyruvyl transferase family protein [Microbacterium neungamense]WCM56063.1 polysaccharide pyruvyl transferase family protein [Microbacterium sp. EF45047]